MLGDLEDKARRDELKQQFRHHADETRQQIDNIEQVFRALGEEPDDSPCQVTKALDKEAKANIKMADDSVLDSVILSGAAETEHHEIAVYEALIAQAEQFDQPEVVQLLQQNLRSSSTRSTRSSERSSASWPRDRVATQPASRGLTP